MSDPQDRIPDEMPHVLACDVGNSAIKFAHVHGDKVYDIHRCKIGELGELGREVRLLLEQIPQPRRIVAASVNPAALRALEAAILEAADEEVVVIGRDIGMPIPSALPAPQTTGVDRLCAAAAAYDQLGTACVIADFGSAITVDCVSDEGIFLGGAILPGLAMAAGALERQTAQLPAVELAQPQNVFGQSTVEAIRCGLYHGARGALKELTEAYATALGAWPTVIVTGGDAQLVAGDLIEAGIVQAIVPDLLLRGVAIGYYRSLIEE